jgi:hypothetical protein
MDLRRLLTIVGVAGVVAAGIGISHAQQIWVGGYGGGMPPKFPTATTFAGSFNFCRAMFMSDRREKQGWRTDYPGADINFSVRLGELTKVNVKRLNPGTEDETPDAVVVRLTDEAMFQCPFLFMQDVGTARFTDEEVERLREYLEKGGFLLVSDYHGPYAKEQFDEEIGRALPRHRYPIVDLSPPDHAIWRTMFPVTSLPQMASIATWRRTGGGVIERWNEEGAPPSARGIVDAHGRLMVVMVHNTDMPDAWEREGEDPEYFFRFSPEAYAMGIDIVLYAMTH